MKNYPSELPYWVALNQILKLDPAQFAKILQVVGTISQLFSLKMPELQQIGFSEKAAALIGKINWQLVDDALEWAHLTGRHILTWQDEDYPALLKKIPDSPPVLYVWGDTASLNNPQIAIVGSRSATFEGLRIASHFASGLAKLSFTITSGLAYGIDQACHKATFECGGQTIAVIGSGLKQIYPPNQEKMLEKIISNRGAIVSEFALHAKPRPYNFPQRNRIISGLCLGVVVIEAALRSGSLITAKIASEQGREVFAVPGSIFNSKVKGCHALIRQGAKLIEGIEDILEELPPAFRGLKDAIFDQKAPEEIKTLDQEGAMLIECMGCEVTSADTLIVRSGLTPEQVISKLLVLELQGEVIAVPGGYLHVKRF